MRWVWSFNPSRGTITLHCEVTAQSTTPSPSHNMQQTADDSQIRLEKALAVVVRTVGPRAAQALSFTCSATLHALRQTAQALTIVNPTAAELEWLATRWGNVTDLTLAGEFDSHLLDCGVHEGWWSTLKLQRLTLQHCAPPNPTGRLLIDLPTEWEECHDYGQVVLRLGPLSLTRIAEEAAEEEATRDSLDRRIDDIRALQDYKEGYDFNLGTVDAVTQAQLDQWRSKWRKQLPAAVAAQRAEPLRHLPAAAAHLGSLTALDLSTYIMQQDGMQLLAAAAPSWPQLLSLKLHGRWMYASDALKHLAAAAPHWPLLQQFWTAEESRLLGRPSDQEKGIIELRWPQLLEAGRHWPQLEQLALSCCVIRPGMVEAAAAWPQLKVLVLRGFGPSWPGHQLNGPAPLWREDNLQTLLQALQHWPLLEHLDLPKDNHEPSPWLQQNVAGALPNLRQVLLHVHSLNMSAAARVIEQHGHHLTSLSLVFIAARDWYDYEDAYDVQPLAAVAECLPQLHTLKLELSDCRRKPALTGLSAAAPFWPRLTSFSLKCSSGNSKHVLSCMQELVAAAPSWRHMKHFELNQCARTYGGGAGSNHQVGVGLAMAVTAAAQHWHKLTSLQLACTTATSVSVSMLDALAASASSWPFLQQLGLDILYGIGPEGCQVLATAAPAWPHLEQLSITFGRDPGDIRSGRRGALKDDGRGLAALAAAAVHWPCMTTFELRFMDLYSNWGLRCLADTVSACWPRLTRLDLDACGDLSEQIKYLSKVTSLRELRLPGCTLSIESDLPELRKLTRVVVVLSSTSSMLLDGLDMWKESVETQMRKHREYRSDEDEVTERELLWEDFRREEADFGWS